MLSAPFVPVVEALNSDTLRINVGGVDPNAERVVIMCATVVGSTVGAYVPIANRPTGEFPLNVENLIPATKYRLYAYVYKGSSVSAGSAATIDATTHFLYAETRTVSISALNVTNANLTVWRSPTVAIVGESIGAGTASFGEQAVQVGADLRAMIRIPLPRQLNPKVRNGDTISLQVSKPPTNTRIITDAKIVEERAGLTPTITSDGGGATAALTRPENQTAVTTVTASEA